MSLEVETLERIPHSLHVKWRQQFGYRICDLFGKLLGKQEYRSEPAADALASSRWQYMFMFVVLFAPLLVQSTEPTGNRRLEINIITITIIIIIIYIYIIIYIIFYFVQK